MTGGGGQIQVVQVRRELDLALADSLAVRGYAAIGRQARVLLLDLAGVSFCDACGLSALVRIANHADRAGCRYGLIAPAAAGGEGPADHRSGPAATGIHQRSRRLGAAHAHRRRLRPVKDASHTCPGAG